MTRDCDCGHGDSRRVMPDVGILGSDDPSSDAGFSTIVGNTGLVTCTTFASPQSYFLVVGTGPAGDGPWGHYER